MIRRLGAVLRAGLVGSCALWFVWSGAYAAEPPKSVTTPGKHVTPAAPARVHGELSEVDGVRVLRVWGSPQQRGHAQGCLLGKQIVSLFDQFLESGVLGGSPQGYEEKILPALRLMKIEPRYEAEMRGILTGVEAIFGGPVEVSSLKRRLTYEDIAAINCVPDLSRLACSSFAAWGKLTPEGKTIVGRNLDWYVVPALKDTALVLVELPQGEADRLGWASLTWPGFVVCTTGLNSDGVVVSMHDAAGESATVRKGFTPRGFALREVVETVRAENAFDEAERILRERTCAVGNNVMVSRPFAEKGYGAVVFEYDGNQAHDGGVTVREPSRDSAGGGGRDGRPGSSWITCTNHYRKRMDPSSCDRYEGIQQCLMDAAASRKQMTIDRAWEMLGSVSFPRGQATRIITHHSAVFEPNNRKMHVAFSVGGKPAVGCRKVTLDLQKLLAKTPSETHAQ